MRKVRELVVKASQDFELAKAHKQLREYVTATVLYNKAVEKVLKALFISKTRKEPPANASIDYLASRTGVPEEISVYISSLRDDNVGGIGDDGLVDLEYASIDSSAERRAFYMDGLAKRLLDYVNVSVKI
jgi:HEPN domain-containing protein